MKVLFGIILLHMLVIIRAKASRGDDAPYFSTAFITLIMSVYVLIMMFIMEEPTP